MLLLSGWQDEGPFTVLCKCVAKWGQNISSKLEYHESQIHDKMWLPHVQRGCHVRIKRNYQVEENFKLLTKCRLLFYVSVFSQVRTKPIFQIGVPWKSNLWQNVAYLFTNLYNRVVMCGQNVTTKLRKISYCWQNVGCSF